METQNMKAFVLALCLAVFVATCWAHGPEPAASVTDPAAPAVNAIKNAGNAVKDAATPAVNAAEEAGSAAKDAATPAATAVRDATAPAAHAAAEKSESFAQWAYDKLSS
uniref:Uncharacterized protein n=2 Tax=Cajanus cajan TaxID=3821 RepID=A0A151SEH7_CAJCA|nr:hypothetical protein KK1_024821 [Cajanus cajan]